MKIRIDNPCQENWDAMKSGLSGRHCESCNKQVIDFTSYNREQILSYMLLHQGQKVCGRLNARQLDFADANLFASVRAASARHANSNLPFYVLTLAALILAGCNEPTVTGKVKIEPDTAASTEVLIGDTVLVDTVGEKTSPLPEPPQVIPPDPGDPYLPYMGEVIVEPPDVPDTLIMGKMMIEPAPIFTVVDVMPEFPGGMDSLIRYLATNVSYPEWEKENQIEGRVFVKFVVDTNGKVRDPEILKSVPGSRNFDSEVLRLVTSMPNWTPGRQNGRNVAVYYTLPVKFTLR